MMIIIAWVGGFLAPFAVAAVWIDVWLGNR